MGIFLLSSTETKPFWKSYSRVLIHNPSAKTPIVSSWQSPAGAKRWMEMRNEDWKLDPNICGDHKLSKPENSKGPHL